MAAAASAGGAAPPAQDANFDYMFKLLIIGNSSVGKTYAFLFVYVNFLAFQSYFSAHFCFDTATTRLHRRLFRLLASTSR